MKQSDRFFKHYDADFDLLFNDLWTHRLYEWLLRNATHREYEYNGMILKPGHYVRSVSRLIDDIAYMERNAAKKPGRATIKRSIEKLEELGLIETEYPIKSVFSHKKVGTGVGTGNGTEIGTLFTVVKMQSYQGIEVDSKSEVGTGVGTGLKSEVGSITRFNKQDLNNKSNNNMSSKPDRAYPFEEIVNYLNSKCGTNFRANTSATQVLIKARMNESFTLEDFKRVIDTMAAEWMHNSEMQKYLRPQTLFGTKFESYLNQKPATASGESYKPLEGRTIKPYNGPYLD